jgi:acetyltransferase-like isoleucine patch superfamily enzyme/glycosyltransferase involved in cell wall biosynthesis
MKILYIGDNNNFSTISSGFSRLGKEYTKQLKDLGDDVKFIDASQIKKNPFMFIPKLGYPSQMITSAIKGNIDLGKILDKEDIDIIQATWWQSFSTISKRNAAKAKVVITFWHDDFSFQDNMNNKHKTIFNDIFDWNERRNSINAYNLSDAFICISEDAKNMFIKYYKNLGIYDGKKRLYVVNITGAGEKYIESPVWVGERKDFIYIGSIFQDYKNLEMLLKTMSEINKTYPSAKLHIFTSTRDPENFIRRKNQIAKMDLSNLIVHKNSSDEEVIEVLKSSVALLHLSMKEGFGIPIIEAVAVGTPVVTLKNSAIPNESKKYSYQYDENELVPALIEMMKEQLPAKKELIDMAKKISWKNSAENIRNIYQKELELKMMGKNKPSQSSMHELFSKTPKIINIFYGIWKGLTGSFHAKLYWKDVSKGKHNVWFNYSKHSSSYENVEINVGDYSSSTGMITIIGDNNSYQKYHIGIGKYTWIATNVKFILSGGDHTPEFISNHMKNLFLDGDMEIEKMFMENHVLKSRELSIGNDVWIGENVMIIGGIRVGDGAVIGAGAVVTHDVLPYEIVGGVPARHIRYRFDHDIIEKLMNIQWWNWDAPIIRDRLADFYDIQKFIEKYSMNKNSKDEMN